MSSPQTHSPLALQSMLAGFADLVGVPHTGDSPDTLEMAFENYAIRAGSHPANPSKLLVLVEVAQLDLENPAASAGLLLDLHHFNADQRFAARWLATIEEDHTLILNGEFDLEWMDAQSFHAILCEAIEHAESLDPARRATISSNAQSEPENNP
jgi:hypothetical protein